MKEQDLRSPDKIKEEKKEKTPPKVIEQEVEQISETTKATDKPSAK